MIRTSDPDRPALTIEVTDAMIEAGLLALDRWANRYGVEDVPAARQCVAAVLHAAAGVVCQRP